MDHKKLQEIKTNLEKNLKELESLQQVKSKTDAAAQKELEVLD